MANQQESTKINDLCEDRAAVVVAIVIAALVFFAHEVDFAVTPGRSLAAGV